MSAVLYTSFESPIGELLLLGAGHALRGLYMTEGRKPVLIEPAWERSDEAFAAVRAQLAEYFARDRTLFDAPLEMEGTPFQRRVWRALVAPGRRTAPRPPAPPGSDITRRALLAPLPLSRGTSSAVADAVRYRSRRQAEARVPGPVQRTQSAASPGGLKPPPHHPRESATR